MNKKEVDKIFSIKEKDEIKPLPYRSFRKGLFGDSMEASLQKLLEQYPDIIPGTQINPGKENPPRFALLCREMSVSSWSLDFLLIDQNAVPTLIEAKLVENHESRRAVVGQIMEYAANSAEEWSEGKLREKAASYWSDRGKDLEDVIDALTDEEDIESFWDEVEENLKQRKIRLIIATDKLRPEVRTIIEFLNTELENVEMLGLEINCYGQDDESVIVVPRIIGQTQATSNKTTSKRKSWDEKSFFEELKNKVSESDYKKVKKIFEETKELGEMSYGTGYKKGSITLKVSAENDDMVSLYNIYTNGKMRFFNAYQLGEKAVQELKEKYGPMLYEQNPDLPDYNNRLWKGEVKQIEEDQVEEFIQFYQDVVEEIKELETKK